MDSRVALVSGAGQPDSLGAAIATALAVCGHLVVATDAPDTGGAAGNAHEFVAADLTDADACAALVASVAEHHGRLDVLVNNAAAPGGADKGDIAEVPVSAWDQVLAVNLRAAFVLTSRAVPEMRRRRWGRVVNIASLVGLTGRPQRAAYAASKAGMVALTRSAALDVAGDGITVNAVCPGLVRTGRTMRSFERVVAAGRADSVQDVLLEQAAGVPMGRLAEPEEVASLVTYLVSEGARFITGEAIGVHGGELFAGGSPGTGRVSAANVSAAKESVHV